MYRKNVSFLWLFSGLFLLGCNPSALEKTGTNAQTSKQEQAKPVLQKASADVAIRVANRSHVEMDNIVVRFPEGAQTYGRLAPRQVTEYRRVTGAYRYAPVEVLIQGKVKKLIAVDYVGEERLPAGNYTYAINFDPNQSAFNGLNLQFKRD